MKIFDFKTDKAWVENIALVTQLGLTMAGCILFCFAMGTKGLFIVVFLLLGIAGGGYTAYRQIMEATRDPGEKKE